MSSADPFKHFSIANNAMPEQTTPLGVYMQQTIPVDDIFRYIFIVADEMFMSARKCFFSEFTHFVLILTLSNHVSKY